MKTLFFIICMLPLSVFGQILGQSYEQLYSANKTLEIRSQSQDMLWVKDGSYNFIMTFNQDSCSAYGLEIPLKGQYYNNTYKKMHECGEYDLTSLSLPFYNKPRICWFFKCENISFYLWDCDMEGNTGDKAFVYVTK